MSSLGLFAPDNAGSFVRRASVAWPALTVKDVQHVAGNRYLVFDDSSALVPIRLHEAIYLGSTVRQVRILYQGSTSDDARGIMLDGLATTAVFFEGGLANTCKRIHWSGNVVHSAAASANFAACCTDGVSEYYCHNRSAVLAVVLRRGGSLRTARTISIAAIATGVAFDGKHLWTVHGNSSVRQYALDGSLIRAHTERTGFNPTSITWNGLCFVCGNA